MLDVLRGGPRLVPTAGDRVIHDETGKTGVVALTPSNLASQVMVRFDGADFEVPVHPSSLEYVERAA